MKGGVGVTLNWDKTLDLEYIRKLVDADRLHVEIVIGPVLAIEYQCCGSPERGP